MTTCYLSENVGDVNSTALGSGARFNAGKPDLSLIPIDILGATLTGIGTPRASNPSDRALEAMTNLGKWQRTGATSYLYLALDNLNDPVNDAARVFTYGTKKYAAWNWAKGMAWSVPVACAGRHALAILKGEINDPVESGGSGLPHEGHIACNLIMLIFFTEHFPQGNDITLDKILPCPATP